MFSPTMQTQKLEDKLQYETYRDQRSCQKVSYRSLCRTRTTSIEQQPPFSHGSDIIHTDYLIECCVNVYSLLRNTTGKMKFRRWFIHTHTHTHTHTYIHIILIPLCCMDVRSIQPLTSELYHFPDLFSLCNRDGSNVCLKWRSIHEELPLSSCRPLLTELTHQKCTHIMNT